MLLPSGRVNAFVSDGFLFSSVTTRLLFLLIRSYLRSYGHSIYRGFLSNVDPFFLVTRGRRVIRVLRVFRLITDFRRPLVQLILQYFKDVSLFPILRGVGVPKRRVRTRGLILFQLVRAKAMLLCLYRRKQQPIRSRVHDRSLHYFVNERIGRPYRGIGRVSLNATTRTVRMVLIRLRTKISIVIRETTGRPKTVSFRPMIFNNLPGHSRHLSYFGGIRLRGLLSFSQ